MLSAVPVAPARKSLFIEQVADRALLREAWYRVQRGGRAGGVDGVTVSAFRPHAERRLDELRESLGAGTYRPSPIKRVQIPKPSGGFRVLGLPTIIDRIAQSAAALVLHDRISALFSDRSFAYRPFLGPRRAAVSLRAAIASDSWVVTADIEKFFDNVEHRILADQVRNSGVDEGGVALLLKWLLAPALDRGRLYQTVKGLPQGAPVAPTLANLYLTGFDTALEAEGFTHVRYADDFVLLAKDEPEAQRALRYISTYLSTRLRLAVKPAKTQLAQADDGFTFVGFRFTGTTWTIPDESIDRLKQALSTLLEDGRPIVEGSRAHNDLVRGWRHYYFGNSVEMDRQLGELDTWRNRQCEAYLTRLGQDANAAVVWFERLVEHEEVSPPAGTYGPAWSIGETPRGPASERPDPWLHCWESGAVSNGTRRFSTASQIHEGQIGRKQLPELLDDGWLRIPTFGAFVAKSRVLLVVRRKKQVIFECPFDDLSCLTVETDGAVISTTVIDECARRAIPIAFCRISGKPVARVISARSPLDPPLVHRQLTARVGRTGMVLVQAILTAKLANQRALLLYHSKYKRRETDVRRRLVHAGNAIRDYLQQIGQLPVSPMRQSRQALFLAEARAAAHYWEAVAGLVPPALGFRRRQHREAEDVVNKALNYGYAHLLHRVWVAVYRAGLDPSLGLLHTGRHRSSGLVFDLMEPFRQPVVDRTILGLIGRGARLEVNRRGSLSLHTRALLQRALARRLASAGPGSAPSLLTHIQRGTLAFRQALVDRRPYRAYRMPW